MNQFKEPHILRILEGTAPNLLLECLDPEKFTTSAWLMEGLAQCAINCPDLFCDQLNIPKGSTYSEAVTHLRSLFEKAVATYGDDFIGRETWWIDGLPVTPAMRKEILESAAELFLDHGTEHREWQYYDDGPGGRVVLTEQTPHYPLMSDFLASLSGNTDWRNRSRPHSYCDELYDCVHDDFLIEKWQGSYQMMVDGNDDYCGLDNATDRTIEWLGELSCQDVVAWYRSKRP